MLKYFHGEYASYIHEGHEEAFVFPVELSLFFRHFRLLFEWE